MNKHIVILAGGSGKRLWPASVEKKPKQFMSPDNKDSLLQKTIKRALLLEPESILILTAAAFSELTQAELKTIPKAAEKCFIIGEPTGRNTAPALLLAAFYLQSKGKSEDAMLVLPADHLISPSEKFIETANQAFTLAEKDYLVTFGIKPNAPETGYGYLEAGASLPPGLLLEKFKEKPDRQTAEKFLAKGNYFWNSGMFCWKISTLLQESQKAALDLYQAFDSFDFSSINFQGDGPFSLSANIKLEKLYSDLSSISIDYAVMEKSPKGAIIPAFFQWNDIGSWDQLADCFPELGEAERQIEANNNFVFSDLPVSLIGVEDLHVIVKNGEILVCKRGMSQKVKKIAENQ